MRKRFLLLPVYFGFFVILVAYEVLNPPFSTDAVKIGNYEVQVSTTPTTPDVGKDTKIHLRVVDQNDKQVDKFRMGLKIYFNDQLEQSFPPDDHPGIWDLDYVFQESGNHVLRADLIDLSTGDSNSYIFNITTLNLYVSIFMVLVLVGVGGAGGTILAIFIFQKRIKKNG